MRRLIIVVCGLMLAGCASLPGGRNARLQGIGSGETVKVNPVGASDIATDVVTLIKKHYGPGQTVFVVSKKRGPIGEAIDDDLRSAGYGVSVAKPTAMAGIRLRYLADTFDPGDILVGVGIGGSFYAMRMYQVLPLGNVEREGDWTVREASK